MPTQIKGCFKTENANLEREIRKKKKELEKLTKLEKHSRERWTKGYHVFLATARALSELKVHSTKKEDSLKKKIRDWPSETVELTKERDDLRSRCNSTTQSLITLQQKQALLKEKEFTETHATDEIVTQVFELNQTAVQASTAREDCLKRHVFPRLMDEKGNLRRQITFDSINGLRRVVAMVNTMTIVRGDLATRAKEKIQEFFERFQKETKINESVKPLYDLTQQLLIEKTDFKVGPDLYRFIAMDLDAEIFPELAEAQILLRQSIRSEKTNSYIRIYERKDRTSPWESVSQS